jgi:hypothetical protein
MPEQEHHAPCGYYGGFVPQQEDMLPYYGGGPSVDCHGFPGDDAGGALPGFEFGAGPGVAGDGYGFGYFNMAGFDDTTSHGFGGMGFPQGWNWSSAVIDSGLINSIYLLHTQGDWI